MRDRDFPADGAALVVGGSGGIGSAICKALATAGSSVAIGYCNNTEAAEALCNELRDQDVRAETIRLDLASGDTIPGAIDDIAARCNGLHSLIFVAGPLPIQSYISQYSVLEWEKAITVEVHGFFRTVQAALPHLRHSRGSIVHLGSAGDIAWAARDGLSIAPKAANEALVRGVAREEGRFGVRANSVLIGVIEAGMFNKFAESGIFNDQWIKATLQRLALKRLGQASEVADAVVFLASQRASYITGQQLAVAGGYGV